MFDRDCNRVPPCSYMSSRVTSALLLTFFSVAVFFSALPLEGAVTTVTHYRLGEADPGAAPAAPGADPTIASTGGSNLSRLGSHTSLR